MTDAEEEALVFGEEKPWWDASNRRNHMGGENAAMEGGFHNDRDPHADILSEKPVHRRMAELHLQGFTNCEIAAQLGYTNQAVGNILRQPYMRKYLVEKIERTVQDELKEFLDAELMPSLRTLKTVRDDSTAKASDRIAASKELVDRRLGRAVQLFADADKPVSDLTQDELQAEVQNALAKLNAQSSPN